MTIKRLLLAVSALLAFTGSALAQTTNVVTNAIPVDSQGLPRTKSEFWVWGISIITPLVVAGVYKVMPNIPKLLLPIATPFIGVGLGFLLNWLQKANLGWVDMAQAGALAVFAREVVSQASKTALIQATLARTQAPPPPPPAPPTTTVTSTGTS